MYQNQKMVSLQVQDQQLGYDILGRLFCAAENYYLKCQEKHYDYKKTKYSSYDIFQNANQKSKDAVRRELINQINIFQTSNKYFLNKYKFGLQPPNIKEAIEDVNLWKQSMTNQRDIELYEGILKVLYNNQINTDDFSNENERHQNSHIGRHEFWAGMGTHASAATQQRIENINNTHNYQPTFQRGNRNDPYSGSNLNEVNERITLSNRANLVFKDIIDLLYKYLEKKEVIKKLKEKYNELKALLYKIREKSEYLIPSDLLKEFEYYTQIIINGEKTKKNKDFFIDLSQVFNEDLS